MLVEDHLCLNYFLTTLLAYCAQTTGCQWWLNVVFILLETRPVKLYQSSSMRCTSELLNLDLLEKCNSHNKPREITYSGICSCERCRKYRAVPRIIWEQVRGPVRLFPRKEIISCYSNWQLSQEQDDLQKQLLAFQLWCHGPEECRCSCIQ